MPDGSRRDGGGLTSDFFVYLHDVQVLWKANQFRASVQMIENATKACRHLPYESLLLRTLNVYCYLRLKMKDEVRAIFEDIGVLDSPVWRFENYPELYPDKRGLMIPFYLRLYAATYLYACSSERIIPLVYMKNLFFIFNLSRQKLRKLQTRREAEIYGLLDEAWEYEIMKESDSSQADSSLRDKLIAVWIQRLEILSHVIASLLTSNGYPEEGLNFLETQFLEVANAYPRHNTYSLMGRICLSMNCRTEASQYFKLAETNSPSNRDSFMLQQNEGMSAIFHGDIEGAEKHFRQCLALAAQGNEEKTAVSHNVGTPNLVPTRYSLAGNNLAVSLMHQKRLSEAMVELEKNVYSEVESSTSSSVLSNILLLYEFVVDKKTRVRDLMSFLREYIPDEVSSEVSMKKYAA